MNKISKLFQPTSVVPKNAVVKNQDITSKSQRLMLELGLIKPTGNGSFYILPLAQRSVDKCSKIIDFYMTKVNAQKISIPQLTSAELWAKSGRLAVASELLTTTDRHDKKHILGPTYEEAITALLASIAPVSYRKFPLRLYQIGNKFRDELKPRFGLMRTKEFLMKDCYSFDIGKDEARKTYQTFFDIYNDIFKTVSIPFVSVQGDTGAIGGTLSHEFQIPSTIGEDHLIKCTSCDWSSNKELCGDIVKCPSCKEGTVEKTLGIEVGHTFLLEDKYSKKLGATFLQNNGKPSPLIMGCYGIGITRLIAASIEYLSRENEIRWPFLLAPYSVCIIPPKDGSNEQPLVDHFVEKIYYLLNEIHGVKNSIIVDDRCHLTIGKRLMDAKRMGYPIIIIIGPKSIGLDGKFEFYNTNLDLNFELSFNDLQIETRKLVELNTYV